MTRRVKQQVCRLLVGILLFAQMAMAAYACPSTATPGDKSGAVTMATGGGQVSSDPIATAADSAQPVADLASDCDAMARQPDPDNPNLCAEHCHFGEQSSQAQTPALPAVLLASLYILPLMPELAGPTRPAAASASVLAAASPPHAILHCCFRI